MGGDIIDFMEYLRKRKAPSEGTVTLEDLKAFCDLKDEIVAEISLLCSLARYSLFLRTLLLRNKDSENRNVGFLVGFASDHLLAMYEAIGKAIAGTGRAMRGVDAAGKTYIGAVSELTGGNYRSNSDAYEAMKSVLYDSPDIVVVTGLSALRAEKKGLLLRDWVKTLDDAHFEGVVPKAELILIDYAAFLQQIWPDIGHYVNILTYSESESEYSWHPA